MVYHNRRKYLKSASGLHTCILIHPCTSTHTPHMHIEEDEDMKEESMQVERGSFIRLPEHKVEDVL